MFFQFRKIVRIYIYILSKPPKKYFFMKYFSLQLDMPKGAAKFQILGGPITTRKNKIHYPKK